MRPSLVHRVPSGGPFFCNNFHIFSSSHSMGTQLNCTRSLWLGGWSLQSLLRPMLSNKVEWTNIFLVTSSRPQVDSLKSPPMRQLELLNQRQGLLARQAERQTDKKWVHRGKKEWRRRRTLKFIYAPTTDCECHHEQFILKRGALRERGKNGGVTERHMGPAPGGWRTFLVECGTGI